MKQSFILENLTCAHCASKIESRIASTEGYENVSFNFATKKLRLESESESLLDELQAICDSIEEGVTVVRFGENERREHEHDHHGHDHHDHDHNHGHDHDHGHDHAHHDHDGCCCGEGCRSEKPKRGKARRKPGLSTENLLLIGAGLFAVISLVLHLVFHDSKFVGGLVLGLCAAATLMSGIKVMVKGVKNLFKGQIDENLLMTVAVIAAFALGEYVEAAMVAVLFSLGEFIEDRAVERSRRDIEKLSQIRPDNAILLRGGREETVPAREVGVGSVIIVRPHERVPLDGEIIEGGGMLDVSALTGESVPQGVAVGDAVMSGAVNGEGLLKLRTTKEFGESTASRILSMVEDAAAQKGGSERFITRFASVYTPVMIGISVLIAVLPPLLGWGEWSRWIYNALVVLVASCPCAIVISVPLSYYAGIGAASRRGVLIKGGKYLEALARTEAVGFDKTGTLTTGQLMINKVYSFEEYSESDILGLASACERYSDHPIARALKRGGEGVELEEYREVAGCGVSARYKGKLLVCGNEKALSGELPAAAPDANVFLVYDGRLIGAIALEDEPRPESADTIRALKKMKIKTVMLTGDSKRKAEQTARLLGISDFEAELMPEKKLEYISRLKKRAKSVCFVGDGINDAPVLAASDCGVAMGLGSEAAIEAADAVLSSGTPAQLPEAIRTSKRAMRTIYSNIIFALAVKLAVIVLACFGLAAIWMSVLADTGVCVICVLCAARLLRTRKA